MIHLIKDIDQTRFCPYCKAGLEKKKFKSEFSGNHHYKTFNCDCGKKVWIKMDFHGSGHDNWNHEVRRDISIQNLEEVLKK